MEVRRRNLVTGGIAAVLGSAILAVSVCIQVQAAPYLKEFLHTAQWDSGMVFMGYTTSTPDSWTLRFQVSHRLKRHKTLDMEQGQVLRAEVSCSEGQVLLLLSQGEKALEVDLSGLDETRDISLEGFETGELDLTLTADDAKNVELRFSLTD